MEKVEYEVVKYEDENGQIIENVTQESVEGLLRIWQDILNLNEWGITVDISKNLEELDGSLSQSDIREVRKHAHINIYPDAEYEKSMLYELLRIKFSLLLGNNDLQDRYINQNIESIVQAFGVFIDEDYEENEPQCP